MAKLKQTFKELLDCCWDGGILSKQKSSNQVEVRRWCLLTQSCHYHHAQCISTFTSIFVKDWNQTGNENQKEVENEWTSHLVSRVHVVYFLVKVVENCKFFFNNCGDFLKYRSLCYGYLNSVTWILYLILENNFFILIFFHQNTGAVIGLTELRFTWELDDTCCETKQECCAVDELSLAECYMHHLKKIHRLHHIIFDFFSLAISSTSITLKLCI